MILRFGCLYIFEGTFSLDIAYFRMKILLQRGSYSAVVLCSHKHFPFSKCRFSSVLLLMPRVDCGSWLSSFVSNFIYFFFSGR